MSKNKVSIETRLELAEVVEHLENILEGLKRGELTVRDGRETLQVRPGWRVDLELSLGKKKNKEKLTLKLSWQSASQPDESALRID